MSQRRRRAFVAAAALLHAGCAALSPSRPPQPTSVDHGILIARVAARGALIPFLSSRADAGEIQGLDESGGFVPNMRAVTAVGAAGYVVFFDLPAGRYFLRKATFRSRGVRYQLPLSDVGAFKRSVVLRPGKAAFLGVYAYDAIWPEMGVAFARIGRIVGHWLTPWRPRPVLPRDCDFRYFEAGREAEIDALHAVRGPLAGTQWRALVEARLRELSAAEPVKVEGLLSREMPLREESILSWRDTLKWGEPRRVPGGLGWRRPGGEAQIAVFFTTATAPGFAGWDAAVAELRRAAATSVQDSGELYEVRVATRAGPAARATTYRYPESTLVGSVTKILLTETILIPDAYGVFTFRLRAPVEEFESVLADYREFLLQLVLGPAKPKGRRAEVAPPVFITP